MLPRLKAIYLKSGHRIDLADGVSVVVGPNNVGKSRILRETAERLQNPAGTLHQNIVVDRIELEWRGDVESLVAWIDNTYGWREPGQYPDGTHNDRSVLTSGGLVLESQIRGIWGKDSSTHPITHIFLLQLDAQSRLNAALDGPSFNPRSAVATSPAQHLWGSRQLESEVSSLMKRAFGEVLTVDRYAGNEIHLLVGQPTAAETAPPPSEDYLRDLAGLERLINQGDGIRAFMGMLLTIRTSNYPLILIDEPEAFLHPPQARLLGRILAEQHMQGVQIVVATHSEDIVQGITGAAPPEGFDPAIVRITRTGSESTASQIPLEKVRALYHDPLLRHSRVLDGLFYQGVAVCEGDSDCAYYNAVLEFLSASGSIDLRDLHFMHCGGKARIWRAVDALKSARVPCVAIVDFDALRSNEVLSDLIAVQKGDIAEIQPDLNVLRSSITAKTRPANRIAAKAQIDDLFSKSEARQHVSSRDKDEIGKILGGVDGWSEAKTNGRRLLSGDALNAFTRIDSWLRRHSVFVVPDGELESFDREIPAGNKSVWLAKVLEGGRYKLNKSAHEFVREVAESIKAAQA